MPERPDSDPLPHDMTDDSPSSRRILVAASLAGATGVLFGAYGAHGLEAYLAETGIPDDTIAKRLDQFEVGTRYHLAHAVALLGLSAVRLTSQAARRWTARLFVGGLVFFSGSLYLLVLTNRPWLGAITPIGGVMWIVGWLIPGASLGWGRGRRPLPPPGP